MKKTRFLTLLGLGVAAIALMGGFSIAQDPQDEPDTPAAEVDPQDIGDEGAGAEEAAPVARHYFGVVAGDGTLVRSIGGVVSARKLSTGRYEVITDTDIRLGTYQATIGGRAAGIEPTGQITVAQRAREPRGIFVETTDSSGRRRDRGFHFSIHLSTLRIATIETAHVMVHRHNSVSLTDADADRILADMGTVLQTKDSPIDVVTRLRYVRNGPVRVLPSTVAAVIQTQAQFNTLMGAGTGIKVVRRIRWCGRPGGSIIGCAPVGSRRINLAVVRYTASQEGILWAHEHGHNATLRHRTDDTNAVMYPSIASNRRVVNSPESLSYLAGPHSVTGTLVVMAAGAAAGAADDANGSHPPKDVRKFVRQHYFEGVPYAAASSYTEKDAEVLLEMLAKPMENDEFLPEIGTTVCFIGGEKAVPQLIKFVKSPLKSEAAFNAKNAVVIHLGDLINRTKSKVALDFLIEVASDPAGARAMATSRLEAATEEAKRKDVTAPTIAELTAELAVSATQGLGLTGLERAEAVLNGLKDNPAALGAVNKAAAEAAKTCKDVRSMGQKQFYKRKEQEHVK